MLISELIEKLQEIQNVEGDIPVDIYNSDYDATFSIKSVEAITIECSDDVRIVQIK